MSMPINTPRTNAKTHPRRHAKRRAGIAAVGAAATGLALVAAGCGGGSSRPGVAGFEARALKYSQCMRSHGITNFPDPTSNGIAINRNSGIDPNSPQFESAERACGAFAPFGNLTPAQQVAANAKALKYAQCMRSRGFPDFPDPNGHGVIDLPATPGIGDSSSPRFQRAEHACQRLANGFIMTQGAPGGGQGGAGK
jgi:hypothetical protein